MKFLNIKKIIIIILVNLLTIFALIQFNEMKAKIYIFIDIKLNADLFDRNFYNMLVFGPSGIAFSSNAESILYTNFKEIEKEFHLIIKNYLSKNYEIIDYKYEISLDKKQLTSTQYKLDSKAIIKLNSTFDNSKKYISKNKILNEIKNMILDRFKVTKNMITANIDTDLNEMEFFINKYNSVEKNDYNMQQATNMNLKKRIIYDKQRLFELIDKNVLQVKNKLDNNFALIARANLMKQNRLELIEQIVAYLILINTILLIIFKYLNTRGNDKTKNL